MSEPSAEPAELTEQRKKVDEYFSTGQFAHAEPILEDAIRRWPDRLGLRLKLARAIELQARPGEAREQIRALVLERDRIPHWARPTFAHFGFAIVAGVKLDISDDAIAGFMHQYFVSGAYEKTERDLLAQVLRPDDTLLEVGGGVGFLAAFAKLQQPSATVVTYEANPALMETVERTKELNSVSFEVRNAMLGSEHGSGSFIVNKAFWASSATHDYGGGSTIEIAVESVDDTMRSQDFSIVVMDIEGGEIELLPVMDLSTVDRLIVETHPKITGQKAVKSVLKHLRSTYNFRTVTERRHVFLLDRAMP